MVSEGYAASKVIHHPGRVCEAYSVTDALGQVTKKWQLRQEDIMLNTLTDILALRPLMNFPRNTSGTIINLLIPTTEKETQSRTTSSSSS
jgi:hypothetical protein